MNDPSPLEAGPMLEFEQHWAGRTGAKDAAIRAAFGVPAARYYQALYAAIDRPEVLELDPMLVRRLQRLRDTRARRRQRRSFTDD